VLNQDTEKIVQNCLNDVKKTLKDNLEVVDRFAKELLHREELEYDEIIAIFNEYGLKEEGPEEGPIKDANWDGTA
jgi:ATP-dependent Zn protease